MAPYENNDMDLVEMDLEAFEIDVALLRELLEEQEGNKEEDYGNILCVVEESKVDPPNVVDMEQEKQKRNCVESYDQCHDYTDHDSEWLIMVDMMVEPTATNNPQSYGIMNWFDDDVDIVGMIDFGYANGECYSQMFDGIVSNEASYGCLWENYDN